jgi:hypothetical protein
MAKRMKVDNKKLLKLLKDGVPQSEIMAKFGFKNSTQLKTAVANAAMEADLIPKLIGGRGGAAVKAVNKTVKVNSRGSLIIPKQLAEFYGLRVGDSFEVRKSKAGLSLKKA